MYDEVPNSVKMHLLPKTHEHYPREFRKEVDDMIFRDPWGNIEEPGAWIEGGDFFSAGHFKEVRPLHANAKDWDTDTSPDRDANTAFTVTQEHLDAREDGKALEWLERLHRLRGNEEKIRGRLPTYKETKKMLGEDQILLTPQEKVYLEQNTLSRLHHEQDAVISDNPHLDWGELEAMGFSENYDLPRHYRMPFSSIKNPETSRDSILPEYDYSLDKTTGWKGVEPVGALRFVDRKWALDAQKHGIKGRQMDDDSAMWEHENDPRLQRWGKLGGLMKPLPKDRLKRMPFDEGPTYVNPDENEVIPNRTTADIDHPDWPYRGNFMFPAPSFIDRIPDSPEEDVPKTPPLRVPKLGDSTASDQNKRMWIGVRGDPAKMTGQFSNIGQSNEGAEGFIEGDFSPEQLLIGGIPEHWDSAMTTSHDPFGQGADRQWPHLPPEWIYHLQRKVFGADNPEKRIAGWEQRDGHYTFYDENRLPIIGPMPIDVLEEEVGGFPWP